MTRLFPQPKKPYQTRRQSKHARYRRLRKEVREAAWRLDGGRCIFRTCRRGISLAEAHMHEPQGRSIDDPCDVDTVVTLCCLCHLEMHVRLGGIKKRLEGSRSVGFRFYERVNNKWFEV
jgi:hypothetical protein